MIQVSAVFLSLRSVSEGRRGEGVTMTVTKEQVAKEAYR